MSGLNIECIFQEGEDLSRIRSVVQFCLGRVNYVRPPNKLFKLSLIQNFARHKSELLVSNRF